MSPTRKLLFKVSGALIVTGAVLVAFGQKLASEEELYSKGKQSFSEKSFKPATEAFEELLKRFPKAERAREVQFLLAESFRIARQFGRESTYPKAEQAYQVLTEGTTEDIWKARGQAGLGRLHMNWNYWGQREKVNSLLEASLTGYEKLVKTDSPVDLKRELAETYIDRIQAGMNDMGYMSPDQVKEMLKQREEAKKAAAEPATKAAPAPVPAGQPVAAPAVQRAMERRSMREPMPPRPAPPVVDQDEAFKKRVEWYARVDALIAKIDALGAGKDLEAKARWTVAQRSNTDEYLTQLIDKYADTELWDDAVFALAQRREGQGKFVEALAIYKKLTDRYNEQQSRFVRNASTPACTKWHGPAKARS